MTDVATVVGKSENAVRILLSRAKASLRAFLCANCSQLQPGARCSCENMIEFSLRRGLIERYKPELGVSEIKSELRRFADEMVAGPAAEESFTVISSLRGRGARERLLY